MVSHATTSPITNFARTALLCCMLLPATIWPLWATAASDTPMQVDLIAEEQGVSVNWLHTNIRQAANMALPQLWQAIIPQEAMEQIPSRVKAVRFLQKAVPNEQGIRILFNKARVLRYLQQHNIPYMAEQPEQAALQIPIEQSSESGSLPSAEQSTEQNTAQYSLPDQPAQPSSLSGAEQPIEEIIDPASMALPTSPPPQDSSAYEQPFADNQAQNPVIAQSSSLTGLLTIQSQSSLPEQILFEQELAHDPHVASLTLRQINRGEQQYRLRLKQANEQWLRAWFQRRGMQLTASVEGWVVQAQAAR